MQTLLSSTALPDDPEALQRGIRRRALDGLELVVGPPDETPALLSGSNRGGSPEGTASAPVRWLLIDAPVPVAQRRYWARQAHLHAGLVVPQPPSSPVVAPLAAGHPTDPDRAQRAAAWAQRHDAATAWTVDLHADAAGALGPVLDASAPTLAHVRLRGSGPEAPSSAPGTPSTGGVLKELALRGYDGTVALAPSPSGPAGNWRRWLLDEREWGCNTAAKKREAAS